MSSYLMSAPPMMIWNQNKRDDIGRCFGVRYERRDNETERHAAHRCQEHYSQIEPEHSANLQDEIADEHEKNALNEGEKSERDRFGDYVVGEAYLDVALALQNR